MRRILLTSLKIAISGGLLYLALRNTDFAELGGRLDWGSVGWIALAIAVCLVQIAVAAMRWCIVSTECGAPLELRRASRYNMIGAFFNQTLPSSIGGDAIRLGMLARAGAGWRAAAYSIFIDRAIGLILLALIVIVSLPWSYSLIADPAGRTALLIVDALALGASAGFLILGRLPIPFLKRWWATHHLYATSMIANRLLFSTSRGPSVTVLSLAVHVLSAVTVWCVIRSVDAPVSFWQIFLLIPPVVLITLIPISIAGWGLRETTMGLAFGYAGLGAHEGIIVSLLYGGLLFAFGALGGLVWIVSAEKASQGDAPLDVPAKAVVIPPILDT